MSYDLLICIRCHKYLDFVLDTMRSVEANTNPRTTFVVFAVDAGNTSFASDLIRHVGKHRVYESPAYCGWGPGLYRMLVESIKHFRKTIEFQHFQSIDYDTLYLKPRADTAVLNRIDKETVGLIGHKAQGTRQWHETFNKQRALFEKLYGKLPATYRLGEGVSGSFMTLTAELLFRMEQAGMFSPPYSNIKDHMRLADDHFLPILVRKCGLDIVDVSSFVQCTWRAVAEPMGMEKRGIMVFHPTKLHPNNKGREADIKVRNYFRAIRKDTVLK